MPPDFESATRPRKAVMVRPGDRVRLELPFSEVCMHLRVAGLVRTVEVVNDRNLRGEEVLGHPMAQLYDDRKRPLSFPILPCEAGIYGHDDEIYCYPVEDGPEVAS